MTTELGGFDHIATLGPLDLPAFARASHLCFDTDRRGPVDAVATAQRAAQVWTSGLILVVTSRELMVPYCASLFGYMHGRVAVVSAFRLFDKSYPDRLESRVLNIAVHEMGHLRGLKHCATPGCVMKPALSILELDHRSVEPCGDCPQTLRRRVGAILRGLPLAERYAR